MKDIIISAKRQRRELLMLLFSFLVAVGCNIYAIIDYNGHWDELYTEIFYVLTLTVIFYICSLLIRLLAKGIKALILKKM